MADGGAGKPKPKPRRRKPKPRPRTAGPVLLVDGGTPPAPPGARADRDAPPATPGPAVATVPPASVEDPGWARETVQSLVAVPFLVAHLLARRKGPADAWLPDDAELAVMAAPLHNIAQRSLRLRALARFGDGVAFATATGGYTLAESRRIARWRAAHGDDAPPPPDADLAGLTVTAAREPAATRDPVDAGATPLRAWRPPIIPNETP